MEPFVHNGFRGSTSPQDGAPCRDARRCHDVSVPGWRPPASTRSACAVLWLAATLLVTACAGSEGPAAPADGVGARFAAEAVAACARAQDSKDAWSTFPVSDFDPTKPDPAKLPKVGTWLRQEVEPTFSTWLADLTALGTPRTGGTAWAHVIRSVRRIDRLDRDQVRAAEDSDPAAFAKATLGLRRVQPELEKAAADAGVATCAQVHAG